MNPQPEIPTLSLIDPGGSCGAPPHDVQAPEEANLSLDMQALNLQDSEIDSVQAFHKSMEPGEDVKYNMLIILAASGMAPARAFNLPTLQQAMAKAWRGNYHGIS